MPNTLTNDQIISATYVALFQRAPDKAGLMFWEDAAPTYGADGSMELALAMANQFAQHPAFTTIYGGLGNAAFINAIYQNIGGKPADAAGRDFWLGKLTDAVNPISRGDLVGEFIYTVLSITPAELAAQQANGDITPAELTDALARQDRLTNKAAVGLEFTNALADGSNLNPGTDANSLASLQMDPAYLASKAIIAGVTEVDATMTAPNAYLAGTPTLAGIIGLFGDAPPVDVPQELRLTPGFDLKMGTGGDDTFIANVVQNELGAQVNTLGSGDTLDGKGGIDTLDAKITSGVFAGGTASMPIQPETKSIEIINLQAVNSGISSNPEVKQIVSLSLGESIAKVIGFIEGLNDQFDPDVEPDFPGFEQVNPIEQIIDFLGGDFPFLSVKEVVTQGAAISTEVYLNAKDMIGVTDIGSVRSDANLTIQNLTTQGLEQLSDMTIHMEYTGNKDSRWNESDLHVYFDQDYLTPERTSTKPTVQFLAMNEDAYDAAELAGLDPQSFALDGVFFRELQFRLNGESFDLTEYLNENPAGTGGEIKSYSNFLAAVQAALVELKADNADNIALQTVTAKFGDQFTTDANPDTLILRQGTAIELSVDGLTAGTANTLSVQSTDLEVARAAAATVPNNNRYELASVQPSEGGEKLGINIALEKVGLAGDGGELVVGSMNKQAGNVYDAVNTTVDGTTSGIEEFYVTVYGNKSKASSLAGLHSTNNNLKLVTVATDAAQTGTFANLTIGNSNTDGDFGNGFLGFENALKDVQTFDASAFKGDLTLFAALTNEVAAKYLTLDDAAPDAPGADNLNFEYTGGTGNDKINLTVSADNGAITGALNREDFLMNGTIAGNDGDDMITLAIVGNADNSLLDSQDAAGLAYGALFPAAPTEAFLANWYDNQKMNANLRIDGGKGNDTIWTPGSGDVIIDGGEGKDTVYADNTGDKAVWAFNVEPGFTPFRYQLNNLQSSINNNYNVFKTDVKVTFLGFEATARIVDTKGVASDLDINQAIKKAINSNDTLSKLLVALDGPGNTLVVSSRIDGARVDVNDLMMELVAPTAAMITAGDANNLSTWYGTPGLTNVTAAAQIAANVGIFNVPANGTYEKGFAVSGANYLDGSNSLHTSDNTITGGADNDVLVLGTGELSNDTVAYKGFGNGIDSIVNFAAGVVTVTDTVINDATVSITTQGSVGTPPGPAVQEVFTLTFTGTVAGVPGNIGFNDAYFGAGAPDVVPAVGDSAATVATAVAASINAGGLWTATAAGGVVTATQVLGAVIGDVDVSNNNPATAIQYDGSGVGVTPAVTTQGNGILPGVAGTTEVFVVTFADADQNGTYSFGGANVPVLDGETGANIAASFASATVAGWTAVYVAGDDFVTYTSTTPNVNVPDVTDASFVGANVVVTTTTTVLTDGFDMLDFSAYNAQGVYVDGVLVAGAATTALGQTYITMVESATNDGSYTMTQYVDAGVIGLAGDTVVGLIGVADFGVEQAFVAQNFVL